MEYKPFYDEVTLVGPAEIRPALHALGNQSPGVFGPDERRSMTSEHAFTASQNLHEDSWSTTVSVEEGARMRELAERLAVAALRARFGDEGAKPVDGLYAVIDIPTPAAA